MRRKTSQGQEPAMGKFGKIIDDAKASAFRGKRIAVFVDDCEHETESFLLEHALFEPLGAKGEALRYSFLFSGGRASADVFLLRSSRDFARGIGALKDSLLRLRADNPGSLIILCAYDPSVYRSVLPLLESGVIDALDDTLANDIRVLQGAAERKSKGGRIPLMEGNGSGPEAAACAGGVFGDLRLSRELLGGAMRGKRIAYVVDDRDYRPESVVLRSGVFEGIGADEHSCVMRYSDFFECGALKADVLVLRSSRLFPHRIAELEKSLIAFRSENPRSAVILCLFEPCEARAILRLAEGGVISMIDDDPPNDFEILRKASELLGGPGAK